LSKLVWDLRFKRRAGLRWIGDSICPNPEPDMALAAVEVPKIGDPHKMTDVQKHNKKEDCWVVINGQVCDLTKFMNEHPGGVAPIMQHAGKDASAEWNSIHSKGVIQRVAPQTVIGFVEG